MAHEHTLVVEYEPPVPITVADGTGIEKGAVCVLTDPNTGAASANGAGVDNVAGIFAYEKIASNGQTQGSIYKRGRFKGTCSGSVTVGDALVTANVGNQLKSATALTQFQISGTRIIGYSLETATTGQTFLWELNIVPQHGA